MLIACRPTACVAILFCALSGYAQQSSPVSGSDHSSTAVSTATSQIPTIAVSNLDANNISAGDAQAISDQLRTDIVATGAFSVLERSQMAGILKEQGFQQSGCTSDECAVQIGQLLGVKYMVLGSLSAAGSYTMLSGRLVDVATGKMLVTRTVKTKGGIDAVVETGTGDLARLLADGFRVATGATVDSVAIKAAAQIAYADSIWAAKVEKQRQNSLKVAQKRQNDSLAAAAASSRKAEVKPSGGLLLPVMLCGGAVVGGGVLTAILLGRNKKNSDTPANSSLEVVYS